MRQNDRVRGVSNILSLGAFSQTREINDSTFSYTDPAGMYEDTEPRWRSRRGSADTGIRPQNAFSLLPSTSLHPLGAREAIFPPNVYGFDEGAPLSKRSKNVEPSIQAPSQEEQVMNIYERYGEDPVYELAPKSLGKVDDTVDQGARRVTIVEPCKDDLPPPAGIPVKGILRRPTKVFPEHPNPIREGVAPLKERLENRGVNDIPTDAKWTKIDRELVNPQALEEKGERFEERLDCVIVLRVLTRDEIGSFARRTEEIRGMFYPSKESGFRLIYMAEEREEQYRNDNYRSSRRYHDADDAQTWSSDREEDDRRRTIEAEISIRGKDTFVDCQQLRTVF
jgi:hypothetical protein